MSKEYTKKGKIPYHKDIAKNWQLYLMTAPYMILFFIFTILPIITAVVLSFFYYNMLETPTFIGFNNYFNLIVADTVFLKSIKNTLIFAVITGPLSYFLCLIIAWFINELPRYLRVLMTLVFYAPSLSSSVYFIWQYLFSGDSYGFINGILTKMGIIYEPIQWLSDEQYTLAVVMIVQVWMSLGTSFLSFIAGFQGIDKSLYEAGDVDGIKNRYQEFFYITFPLLKPQLLFSAVMQIVSSFSVSAVSQSLCGLPSTNYSAHTIVLHITDYGNIRYEMGYACAISVILFLIMLGARKLIDILLSYVSDT